MAKNLGTIDYGDNDYLKEVLYNCGFYSDNVVKYMMDEVWAEAEAEHEATGNQQAEVIVHIADYVLVNFD